MSVRTSPRTRGADRPILNVSSLATYARCPRLFYLSHVKNIHRETVEAILGRIEHDARRILSQVLKRNYAALKTFIEAEDLAQTDRCVIRDALQYERNIALRQHPIYTPEIETFLLELEFRLVREEEERLSSADALLREGIGQSQLIMSLFPFMTEVPLYSQELGLRGRVDEIHVVNGSYTPVDIKTTPYPFASWDASAIQVAAYGMMIEEQFSVRVESGRVYYTRSFLHQEIPLTSEMRAKVTKTIQLAAETVNNGPPDPLDDLDQVKCSYCHLASICRTSDATGIQSKDCSWVDRLFWSSESGDLRDIYEGVK